MGNAKKTIEDLLSIADIKINGNNLGDIQVHNPNFYKRVLKGGSLSLGNSYMDEWWDCKELDIFFYKLLSAKLDKKALGFNFFLNTLKAGGLNKEKFESLLTAVKARLTNTQRKKKSYKADKHYDIGNNLFELMLDERMNYSCGYWKEANTLDKAQEAKLDLICRKIGLKPGNKILDIGCGWGSFAKYAAEKYKVNVVGITVSKEQVELARKHCKDYPMEVRLQDYRKLNEKFDHIISIGMFEHVGYKNYREYMKVVNRNLKEDGLFLLHTIGGNKSVKSIDPWINRHIFPNSMLPSEEQIKKAAKGLFVIEDWHGFGKDYDKTLMQWYNNFTKNWNKLKDKYDSRFYRMWTYYLLSCAASFRAEHNRLWQVVFSKNGLKDYEKIR